MSRHALEVLEFERVLERVAHRASTELGRERVLSLRPRHDREAVLRELSRVSAVGRFVAERPDWGLGPIPDVGGALDAVAVEGAVLEPAELHGISVLLATSAALRGQLSTRAGPYPELASLIDRLVDEEPLVREIDRAIDEEGRVRSRASRELKRLRDSLRGAHAKVVRQLERYMGTLPARFVVPDASVTIREGRYVVPLRREGKGEVGGIVHDESQTGATLYVEPPVAIELMNRVRDLEREEAREVRRVLGELTAAVAPHRDAVRGAAEALVDFDALDARARTARAWKGEVPALAGPGERGLTIRDGRHPLLVEANEGLVVPFDLDLSDQERALVLSGPNTGGKSVLLKAVGLFATLSQSGIVPPTGRGTRLQVFDSFFADIGDEQSIASNLSTFSAHVAHIADIMREAGEGSLVLIDEMGTGTDPAEGAALARAVLEALVDRGATTLVSSHLSEMKQLDAAGSGIVNASLQFDSDRMEPTYRLVKGRPGRSYGLAIARRLGFPPGVLDRAEAYREGGAARLEELLARLEDQEREAVDLRRALDEERARTDRRSADVEGRERTLQEAERSAAERAREDARRLLMEARAEVEDAIRELQESVAGGTSLEEASRAARRRVEGAAGRHRELTQRGAPSTGAVVSEGEAVKIRSSGSGGEVVEVRGDRALVQAGPLRIEVPLSDLVPVEAGAAPETSRAGGWSGPTGGGNVRLEVDLRGLRVDEVELELVRALDEALLADLAELRIIHGKGTGALRERVGEILRSDARVREFRMGGPTEGGAGVTVATF